jgi:hypothetical protein
VRLKILLGILMLIAITMSSVPKAQAQDATIARDLANPFSSIWNIVNQINFNHLKGGLLTESETQFNWNFQPVMPIPLNDQFNLITRPVIPYYKNPYVDISGTSLANLTEAVDFTSGLGDVELAALIAPNRSEGIIYGIGVTFIAPTARNSILIGQGLWQAGPAAGLFYVTKNFVAGVFPQHWRAVSGVDRLHPGTRFTNLQYGISYLPNPKLTLLSSANILIDWTKEEPNRWTVPLSLGISYLYTFGKMPVSIGINYQWVVKHPQDIRHQESILRITFTPVIRSPFARNQ